MNKEIQEEINSIQKEIDLIEEEASVIDRNIDSTEDSIRTIINTTSDTATQIGHSLLQNGEIAVGLITIAAASAFNYYSSKISEDISDKKRSEAMARLNKQLEALKDARKSIAIKKINFIERSLARSSTLYAKFTENLKQSSQIQINSIPQERLNIISKQLDMEFNTACNLKYLKDHLTFYKSEFKAWQDEKHHGLEPRADQIRCETNIMEEMLTWSYQTLPSKINSNKNLTKLPLGLIYVLNKDANNNYDVINQPEIKQTISEISRQYAKRNLFLPFRRNDATGTLLKHMFPPNGVIDQKRKKMSITVTLLTLSLLTVVTTMIVIFTTKVT